MLAHVRRTVSRCFAALRQLRQIRWAVPTATFQMLVVASVHTRDSTTAMQYWSAYQPYVPSTSFAVGAQRGGTTHLPCATALPHLWCIGDAALAACPRTRAVQNRGANVQSASRQCAAISGSGTCCRLSPSLNYPIGRRSLQGAAIKRPHYKNCNIFETAQEF